MISRCICLEAPAVARRTRSAASRAARGGVGGSPSRPKSLAVPTRPRPKWYCQTRLTITRVVSGLSGWVSQLASAVRRPVGWRVGGTGTVSGWPSRTVRIAGLELAALRSPGIVVGGGDRADVGRRRAPSAAGSGLSSSNAASCFWRSSSRSLVLALRPGRRACRYLVVDLADTPGAAICCSSGVRSAAGLWISPGCPSGNLPIARGRGVFACRASIASISAADRPVLASQFASGRVVLRHCSAAWPSGRSSRGQQRGEERLEAVVVGLEDRVELVVVAAGAADASGRGTTSPVASVMSLRIVLPLLLARRAGCTRTVPWRRKPVATSASGSPGRSSSPASCSRDEAVVGLVVVEATG